MDDDCYGHLGHLKNQHKLPAIMTPVSTISSAHSDFGLPDVTLTSHFTSLKLTPDYNDSDEEGDGHCHSFLLLDEKERLKVCLITIRRMLISYQILILRLILSHIITYFILLSTN
jgi:hypothetical protein